MGVPSTFGRNCMYNLQRLELGRVDLILVDASILWFSPVERTRGEEPGGGGHVPLTFLLGSPA